MIKFIFKWAFFAVLAWLVLDSITLSADKRLRRVTGEWAGSRLRESFESLGGKFSRYFNREAVEMKIRQAGLPWGITPEMFCAVKVLLPFVMAGIQLYNGAGAGYFFSTVFASFFLPDLFLGLAVSDRKRAIASELPEVVDIFEAAASAGLETGGTFLLAADFARGKELKKELTLLAAGYAVSKDKEKVLSEFRENIGLHDIDMLSLALLQGDVTGRTKGMLEALSSMQANNVVAKVQRESKAVEYRVLAACAFMALTAAALYLYPYLVSMSMGLRRVFS